MSRHTNIVLALAALTATAAVTSAQSQVSAAQLQPAPIERAYTTPQTTKGILNSQPSPGIFLRLAPNAQSHTISADPQHTEVRIDHGIANISLHQPARNAQILIDLPGGQVDLLKDGLYTFNADTNTVRVLKGEAEAFPSSAPTAKGLKVKEDHQLAFGVTPLRSIDVGPYDARTDLLPSNHGDGPARYPAYGFGGYGYDYPYYGYGYGYPYGFYGGYPYGGIGLGFGYYGGFGGFRGGYGYGGFRGRR